jgi:hypothetical protein
MRIVTHWHRIVAIALGAALIVGGTAIAGLARNRTAFAAAAPAPIIDEFDRANGPVGDAWRPLRGSWSIVDGAVVAASGRERVLARAGLTVGATFHAETRLTLPATAPGTHGWAGLAVDITDHGDGTQDFYALRVAQDVADGTAAQWQLVRIDHSTPATDASLLDSGTVAAPAGTTITLGLRAPGDGRSLVVSVAGASTVARTVQLRLTDLITGGGLGLYSQDGPLALQRFQAEAIAQPGRLAFTDAFARANGPVGNGWTTARGGWAISGGAAVPSGVTERVMYPASVTLGATFSVRGTLTLPATALPRRQWAGLAFNLTDNGDGTQTYYVLRIGYTGEGDSEEWQLLKLTRSSSAGIGAELADGPLTAPKGTTVGLLVESRNRGTGVQLIVTGPGGDLAEQYVGLPFAGLLSGGRAGAYSQDGAVGLNDFGVDTSTAPASPPADPGALHCASTLPGDYPLPDRHEVVTQVIDVGSTWAGQPVAQAVLTTATDQYVAYYDADRFMTVARRPLSSTTWTYQRLDSQVGWDSHNYVTMALDSTGNLHVSGNMHATPLVYFRTTTPGDLATLTRVPTMVDPAVEDQVTYPRFLTGPGGQLLFSYRAGASGNGATYYNRYDPASQAWSPLLSTPLDDGEGLRSAYEEGPRPGPDGYWHLVLVWRDTTDAGSSSMPSYLRSRDLVHWQDSAGNPVALPALYGTAEVIDPVPSFGGTVNGDVGLGFDTTGTPVVTYLKYDANLNSQLYLARPDGHGGWTSTQLTAWTGRWVVSGSGSLDMVVQINHGATVLPDGNLRIDYTCAGAARTLVVDPTTLRALADVPTPGLPTEITGVQSTWPGMTVQTAVSGTASGRYVLRWETLPVHGDQALPPGQPTPPAQPLRLYLLAPAS